MKSFSHTELRAALSPRKPQDHKGVFGHVLIAAGSRGMGGAAILCAKAALRSGAGLVTLALPQSLQDAVFPQIPEAMTLGLPEKGGVFAAKAAEGLVRAHREKGFTVLALGPGLSRNPAAGRFVFEVLGTLPIPTVVDADAINHLAAAPATELRELLRRSPAEWIVTPHPGEMARALRLKAADVQKDREAAVERLAREWGVVALLKGHGTLISDGSRSVLNPTGGTGLAKGGTGDVLTGLIAGLWAQSLASGRTWEEAAFMATALGVWLHGKAGDLSEKHLSPWAMTAADLIEHLPEALKSL
jgi:NAD(P)H-hydrate epimerase